MFKKNEEKYLKNMKKLFLILNLFASISLDAQFVTTYAKFARELQDDGIIYYLPRNVLRLEFTVEETDYYVGPYAEFATKYLGITDYITENKTVHSVKSVDIELLNEVDPNAVYCISADEKNKEPLPNVILDNNGMILAFGYDSVPKNMEINDKSLKDNEISDNTKQKVSFIEILENEIEIDNDDVPEGGTPKTVTPEDKAKLAAEKISSIRNSCLELVSGEQEVSYGSTLKYMVNNMKDVENEYVSLFKGKTVKRTYKKVVCFAPEENQSNAAITIAKLSKSDGIIEVGGKGDQIKIQFEC